MREGWRGGKMDGCRVVRNLIGKGCAIGKGMEKKEGMKEGRKERKKEGKKERRNERKIERMKER